MFLSEGGGGGVWCPDGGSDTIPWKIGASLRRGRVVALDVGVATLDWSPLAMVVGGGALGWGMGGGDGGIVVGGDS